MSMINFLEHKDESTLFNDGESTVANDKLVIYKILINLNKQEEN